MAPESSRLLGIQSDSESYRMTRLPLGLTTSPFVFQRLMNRLLSGYQYIFAVSYIDDILTYSGDWTSHVTHLRLILERIHDSGLRLRADKCNFAQTKLRYLGMVISYDRIEPDPDKLALINKAPRPTNAKMLKSFLGLTGFYRMYIRGYRQLIAPFRDLLKKNVPFVWTKEHQEAFQCLKTAMTSAPVYLAVPNWQQRRALITDASRTGCGFLIVNDDDQGIRKVLSYGGRLWSKCESQWSVSELELACILYALEKYSHFFLGTQFKIYTDHISNTFIKSLKFSHGKLFRWSLKLQHYNFEIVRLPGKNMPPDYLSRMVNEIDPKAQDLSDDSPLVFAVDSDLSSDGEVTRPTVLRPRDKHVTKVYIHDVHLFAVVIRSRSSELSSYEQRQ